MSPTELLHHLLSLDESADLSPWRASLTLHQLQAWKTEAARYALSGDMFRALAVTRCLLRVGDWLEDEAILALGHWTGGNANYLLARYSEAFSHYQIAESYYRVQADWLNLARLQIGMVGTLSGLKRYEEARQVGEESWAVLTANDAPENGRFLASLANNRGIAADCLGRYEEALDFYQYKLTYWQNQPETHASTAEIGRTRLNMGLVKKRLNLWAEAEMDLRTGRTLLAQLPPEAVPQTDQVRGAVHLADLLARRGASPEEVIAAFHQAKTERAALSTPPEDLPDLLHLDVLQAEWQIRYNHITPDTAEYLETLHRQAMATGQAREVSHLELLLADYTAQTGDRKAAVTRYTRLCHSLEEEDLLCRAWHGLGRVYHQTGDITGAQQAWEAGVGVIEANRRMLSTSYFRSGFLEDKLGVYRDLIVLCLEQERWETAFQWAERARSRELVEWLAGQSNLPGGTANLVSPSEVCAVSPSDTLFLAYVLVGETFWVFPLTHDAFYPPRPLGSLPPAHVVEQTLSQLYQLGQFPAEFVQRRASTLLETGRNILGWWYEQFLRPVDDLLEKYEKVIVVPDGLLYRLPIHAFYDTTNGRYLIETHEIHYAAGATAWFFADRQSSPRGQGGLFLGYDGEHLHHTTTEIEAITSVFPHFAAYIGEAATCERLEEAETADLIHIAAHALFRADHPLFSGLDLANSRLEAQDILRLRLHASLVCLSACETGRGLLRGGEYLGLAHAFLLAGAGTVLATHWAVDDAATAGLMNTFYQALSQEQALPAALRTAQRAMLASTQLHLRHPYYWAAFFLFGGTR